MCSKSTIRVLRQPILTRLYGRFPARPLVSCKRVHNLGLLPDRVSLFRQPKHFQPRIRLRRYPGRHGLQLVKLDRWCVTKPPYSACPNFTGDTTIVSAYWGTILAYAIISANKGRPVWKDTVKTADFVTGKAASSEYSMPPMQQQAQHTGAYSAHQSYSTPYAAQGYVPQSYDPPASGFKYGGGPEV